MKAWFMVSLLLGIWGVGYAQDTLNVSNAPYKPGRAALYSAILPGLGQGYVKKYWKIPIVYAAGIGTGTVAYLNHKQYKYYQDELIYRKDHNGTGQDVSLKNVSSDNLRSVRDDHRRYRDMFTLLTMVVYAGNIIDAYVDAHLATYDISDKLSLRVSPAVWSSTLGNQSNRMALQGGLQLNLNLK